MAFGVALWSVMTALGGAAGSFTTLAFARIGVGVGEAVANPCSNSLLADVFPKQNRAMALGANLSGTFLGGAAAMVLGGVFLQYWDSMCTALPWAGACSVKPWQAALYAVGLCGLPLSLLILLIREPARPAARRSVHWLRWSPARLAQPCRRSPSWRCTGWADGRRCCAIWRFTAVIVAIALLLYSVTGDKAQWAAFAFGTYAVITWGQVQCLRDKPLFSLTYGDRTFVMAAGATALIACIGGAVGVWAAPYAMRTFDKTPTEIGLSLGLIAAAGGFVGVLIGGCITDRWRARDLRAPMGMLALALTGIIPGIVVLLATRDFTVFLAAKFVIGVFSGLWGGATAALMQDLVLPRMRGAASAAYSLVAIVVASGIGPYWAGKVSVLTGSLNAGLFSILLLAIPAYAADLADRAAPARRNPRGSPGPGQGCGRARLIRNLRHGTASRRRCPDHRRSALRPSFTTSPTRPMSIGNWVDVNAIMPRLHGAACASAGPQGPGARTAGPAAP